MSVTQTLRVVEIVRAIGVPVTFEHGWETRGNGQSSAYQGGIIHHTGGNYATTCPGLLITGRPDLDGPLCNFAGLANGVLHVVAAHPANHAGASGGPSNGPFPVTGLFNRLVMGLEICYPGSQPMTPAQYATALAFAKAMEAMFGSVERARLHAETSREGKWDAGWGPGKTISGAVLRAEATRLTRKGLDMLTPDDGNTRWAWINDDGSREESEVATLLGKAARRGWDLLQGQAQQKALLAQILAVVTQGAADPAVIMDRLEKAAREGAQLGAQQAVQTHVLPVLREAVAEALGDDNSDQAKQIVDLVAERLARRVSGEAA